MSAKLSDDKKGAIFRKLASKTLYDAGIEFGLDKHYSKPSSVRNAVYGIYRQVQENPERFAVQPETVDLVVDAVSSRKAATAPKMTETQEKINQKDIKQLTLSSRDKAAGLIRQKLEYLEKHPKALKNESLVTLGKIYGILFDKGQIVQGQATEHIAMMAQIDKDMPADEALNAVLKMREQQQSA